MRSLLYIAAAVLMAGALPTQARTIKIYTFNGPNRKAPAPVVAPTDSVAGYPNMKVGSVTWASVNIDDSGKFAAKPDMFTKFYQWNKGKAWAATGVVTGWTHNSTTDTAWTVTPCPAGWRLPTQAEYQALHDEGSMWANAGTRGNAVAGRFYGTNNTVCELLNNMTGCIFLPITDCRDIGSGMLYNQGNYGYYWSSVQSDLINAYILYFYSGSSSPDSRYNKEYGFAVRCVK
jgi:uncharacterized protein (TIGR02145 family)